MTSLTKCSKTSPWTHSAMEVVPSRNSYHTISTPSITSIRDSATNSILQISAATMPPSTPFVASICISISKASTSSTVDLPSGNSKRKYKSSFSKSSKPIDFKINGPGDQMIFCGETLKELITKFAFNCSMTLIFSDKITSSSPT
jgi:hypothetical protein